MKVSKKKIKLIQSWLGKQINMDDKSLNFPFSCQIFLDNTD